MEIKVLICDDDFGMRLMLKKAVEKVEGFKIVGEAEDGEAALSLYQCLNPEVVFIDVEMPKLDGLECAKLICDKNPKTKIIFATGHNEYMSDAFKFYAFDYLIKPFKVERIHQTLARIKELYEVSREKSIHEIIRYESGINKILLKNKEGINFVDMDDIIIIQREERATVIYTSKDSYSTSETLGELEDRLDKNQFFRSHKSYIINLSRINKIYPYGRWTYIIKLKDTEKDALLTHDKYEELKKLFNI